MKTLDFKNKEAYRKYNAYRFIHGDYHVGGTHPDVLIGGKKHKVHHLTK